MEITTALFPPLFVVDTETTGLEPEDGAIVELAAVAVVGGEVVSEFASLVWPGREYLQARHQETLAISGIGLPDLIDMGAAPPAETVCARWAQWMAIVQGDAGPYRMTAYNAEFESRFLRAPPWAGVPFDWQGCVMRHCTERMGAARALEKRRDGQWRWPKLIAACDHFGIELDGAHRALADARAAARLALYLDMG